MTSVQQFCLVGSYAIPSVVVWMTLIRAWRSHPPPTRRRLFAVVTVIIAGVLWPALVVAAMIVWISIVMRWKDL